MVSGGELNQMSGGVSGALNSVTEFCDLVPNNYLPSMPTTKVQMVQGNVARNLSIFPRLKILKFVSFHSHNYCSSQVANRNSRDNGLGYEIENSKQQSFWKFGR